MSFSSTIKNLFFPETKALLGVDGIGRTNPLNYATINNATANYLTRNDAQLSSVFYTITNSIQTTAKSIPWNVYAVNSTDDNAKKLPNHPLAKLLYRPNPKQSWSDFVTQYIGHFLATGNVYILAISADLGLNAGKPTQWWILPTNTEILSSSHWMADVTGYRVPLATGGYDSFSADQVLHIKKFNLNNSVYGMSPITAGTLALTSIDYAMRQRVQQLVNGGPRTILYNEDVDSTGLTEDQELELGRKINRPNKFTFLNTKIGSTQIGLSPVDLDLLNSVQADSGMVADMLGYPSILLSGNKSTTYNNVSEANKALYSNCIIPLLHELRDGLNHKFGSLYSDSGFIDCDLSNIEVMKPNLTALIAAAATATFMTVNEQRHMCGLPALTGGDGFLRNAALQYLPTITDDSGMVADAYAAGDAAVAGN